MVEIKNKKWQLALGIIGILAVAGAGIFRATGCEKGAEITETVGGALDDIVDPAEEGGAADVDTEGAPDDH